MSYSKASKSSHVGKRQLESSALRPNPPRQSLDGAVQEPKRKRVWKACERCKVKKIKCDAATPCKRCKEDGMICVTKSRRRTEFTSIPQGYAEVLENTHFSLVATVEKLYYMLRNGESWLLDEPQTNERGIPIIHDVAKLLGCLRETQDNLWVIPDVQEAGREVLKPKQEPLEGSQKSLSPNHSPSRFEGLDCLSHNSDSTPSPVNQEMAVHLDQQEHWSLFQKDPLPVHEDSQQKDDMALPSVPKQDSEDNCSNKYPCQMDSLWYQSSESGIGLFDAPDTTYMSPPELSPDILDSTMWSDELAWRFFTDA